MLRAADVSPGLALEQAALAALEALPHGMMRITIRSATNQALEAANGREETIQLVVEYAPHSLRVRRSAKSQVDADVFTNETERVLRPGQLAVVEYDRVQVVEESQLIATKRDELFDPRLLATCTSDMLILDQLESVGHPCIAWEDRRNESVTDELMESIPVKRVQYERVNGTRFDLWIAPSMDHALLHSTVRSATGKSEAVAKRRFREVDGRWFPDLIRFTQRFKDKTLVDQEAVIDDLSFDPVNEARFDLSALDLRPGTEVLLSGGRQVWNGKELIDPLTVPRADVELPRANNWFRWILLANALLCGAFVLARLWRHRVELKRQD
jgi:hypothetical protein